MAKTTILGKKTTEALRARYVWFLEQWSRTEFGRYFAIFGSLDLMFEKDIAQNDWDEYFYETEKNRSNSLSVLSLWTLPLIGLIPSSMLNPDFVSRWGSE